MHKYDSLLYGNGLTLSVLNIIKDRTDNKFGDYLNCNTFILDFINAKYHKRILREYLKYFNLTERTKANHDKARIILHKNYNEISSLGFERWVSKHLLDENKEFHKFKLYGYILYNYWYHCINERILLNNKIRSLRNEIGTYIKKYISNRDSIFTTNFDNVLDDSLHPQHIHGRFRLPLDKIENIILQHKNDEEFEYKYLFGTNGLEKLTRLTNINKLSQSVYDLDFLFNNSLALGSLLIFGMAFGKAEFISDDFLSEYPEHKKNKLLGSVDGHILHKLIIRFKNDQLNKITITYFSNSDKINYESLFTGTEIEKIIEYKQCDDVFNFNDIF